MVIYPEGVWYQVKSEADVKEIMERHIMQGEVVTRLIMPDHPAPTKLPSTDILARIAGRWPLKINGKPTKKRWAS